MLDNKHEIKIIKKKKLEISPNKEKHFQKKKLKISPIKENST